jgi:hypothetical protein
MTITLRSTLKRTALILTMAVAGLTVATQAVPAAHAATASTPSITAQAAYSFYSDNTFTPFIEVQGSHFTPGGSVNIEILDSNWNLIFSRTVSTSIQLHCQLVNGRPICYVTGGTFNQWFAFPNEPESSTETLHTYYVIARDYSTGLWSNWSIVSMYF